MITLGTEKEWLITSSEFLKELTKTHKKGKVVVRAQNIRMNMEKNFKHKRFVNRFSSLQFLNT